MVEDWVIPEDVASRERDEAGKIVAVGGKSAELYKLWRAEEMKVCGKMRKKLLGECERRRDPDRNT